MHRYAIVFLSLALLVTNSTFGKDPTPGNPPRILIAGSIDVEGNLELVSYRTIYIGFNGESYNHRSVNKVSLKDVTIQRVSGEEVSLAAAHKLLAGKESPILATSWKSTLPDFYRPLLTGDSLLLIFPRDAPNWKEIQDPSRPLEK